MEKPNDRIIRFAVYGFLIGIIFPFASLILHAVTKDVSFSLDGFLQLHSNFPGQFILDLVPVLSTVSGFIAGYSESVHQLRLKKESLREKFRSEHILAFTEKLMDNQLDAELNLHDPEDPLGRSLINLRDNLKKNIEEQQNRKMIDDQRNWVSQGLAQFGEILRGSFDNMEEFSFNIISYLVKYLNANQGGFFLVEKDSENNLYFDLKASYAYDRKKFSDKRIEWGEGLIGTCALEMQSIYMTDIPEGYLEITSGIGQAPPDYLLIVPLVVQEEVLGIIELASFNSFHQYEIAYVEGVAESTAITLSSIRSNIRTATLLKESQNQAEVLAMQEEKMRMSMDQLKETQEKAARQAEKFISFTSSVNHTLIRAEYSADGILLYANTKFLNKLGYYSNAEVEGQHISKFIDKKDLEWFNPIWKRLSEGGKHYEGHMKHLSKTGQDLWTVATYTCLRKDDGSVDRILFLAIDNTEDYSKSLDYEGQIESINRLNVKVEFAPDGKFINCNDLFLEKLKFTKGDLARMSVFDFIEKSELENFNETWGGVTRGVPFQGQMKFFSKYEDEKWFRVSYSSVNDMYGEVAKVICLATDITNEKIMELESRGYTEQLKIQEDKLKLASVELKKKLDQSKADLENQYRMISLERERMSKTLMDDILIILTIDESSKILFINHSAEKFFGITKASSMGKNIRTLFPGPKENYDSFILSLFELNALKVVGEIKQVRIPDKSGEFHNAEIHLSLAELKDEVSYTAFISIL